MRAARSAPSLPLPCHSLGAGMPRCSGSQDRQVGEQPELRGQAAAQVVALKLPARGAPERDHWGIGDECRGRQVQRARFSYASLPSVPTPNPYPATAWRRGCRAAAAHRTSSAVRSPSCEGKLPLTPSSSRYLQEGHQTGGGME
eukprot:scaffold112564_cov27-Phaeocystis_antarctica.AAC.1